jgi:hypothetical protein
MIQPVFMKIDSKFMKYMLDMNPEYDEYIVV